MISVIRFSPRSIRAACKFGTTTPSSTNSKDDDDKTQKAKTRLQNLLVEMASSLPQEEKPKIITSHPVKHIYENRPTQKIRIEKIRDKHTAQLVSAVKDVADEVGGPDVKATEAELLHVLLNNKRPDGTTTEPQSLENVISGMQVERDDSRAEQVRRQMRTMQRSKGSQIRERLTEPVNLFGHPPLGIFQSGFTSPTVPTSELTTWSNMTEKEMKLLVTHPPTNIFEEMILWTERGKLWKFPIDNELGLDEEKKIDFTQHVFLDEHLEGWCPAKGPIRHFMELVLVGLSKNPYITVQAKIDHINWFRDYFEGKKKLLQSVGAIPEISTKDGVVNSSQN